MNFKRASIVSATMLSAGILALANSTAASALTYGHAWNDSPSTNECLAAAGNVNDTNTVMWTCDAEAGQQWAVSASGWDSGWLKISNENGSCLTFNPLVGNVTASTCAASDAADEEWLRYGIVSGMTQWLNRASNECLSVANGSTANGAEPIVWKCQTSLDQLWGGSLK